MKFRKLVAILGLDNSKIPEEALEKNMTEKDLVGILQETMEALWAFKAEHIEYMMYREGNPEEDGWYICTDGTENGYGLKKWNSKEQKFKRVKHLPEENIKTWCKVKLYNKAKETK